MNISNLFEIFIGGGFFLLALCILVHICSKDQCTFKYKSKKRKFEIHPHKKDKSQTPKN